MGTPLSIPGSQPVETQCGLCLQPAKLCRSHIIPEWLYGLLYDEKHRLQVLSVLPDQRNQYRQKGLTEPLLCAACETQLSTSEGYVQKVFKGGVAGIRHEMHPGMTSTGIRISGLDYTKFKLFELSILWRAGVSKLQFFSKVQLGAHHEESLRAQLLASDPGPADRYAVLLYGLKAGGELLQAIAEPKSKRGPDGQRIYPMMFGGFLWVFHVGAEPIRKALREAVLQTDGSRWISVKDATEMENLRDFATELHRLGRAPPPA